MTTMNKQLILWLVVLAISVLQFFWPFESRNSSQPFKHSEQKGATLPVNVDDDLVRQIKSLCDRLKSAVKRRFPVASKAGEFNPHASNDEIAKLESFVGSELPADFKIYLQTMNGQKWRVALPKTARLLPADKILQYSQENVGHLENSMKKLPMSLDGFPYWHPRVLFVSQSDGDGDVIDTLTGEIRPFVHDGGIYQVSETNCLSLLKKIVEAAEDDTEMMLDFGPPGTKK